MGSLKTLALITARGGSKGLPRKNILMAGGKPLIAWTIEAARQSKIIDQVVLSSDDDEIINIAKSWGCSVPFRRPELLANDSAKSMDVVIHALEQLPGFEYVILLQPTSPMRTSLDIDTAFEEFKYSGAPTCVSVCEAEQSPYWMYYRDNNKKINNVISQPTSTYRRQDLPKVYILNGAIYISRVDWLLKNKSFIVNETIGYVMTKENSLDIDTSVDFKLFESYIATVKN